MVAMAVMAILTIVAVPSYTTYISKARQKEGFVMATAYSISAASVRAEYGFFPGNLVQTGFQPVGQLGYRLFAADNRPIGLAFNDPSCVSTSAACNCGGACAAYKTWIDSGLLPNGLGPTALGTFSTCGSHASVSTTDSTFSARISGQIKQGASRDVYAFDHRKEFELCSDGLK